MKNKLKLGVIAGALVTGGIAITNSDFGKKIGNILEKKQKGRELGEYNTYFSNDPKIAEIQRTHGINHLNSKTVFKDGKTYNPENRIKNLQRTPKSILLKGDIGTREFEYFAEVSRKFMEKTGCALMRTGQKNINFQNVFAINPENVVKNGKMQKITENQKMILKAILKEDDLNNKIIFIEKNGVNNVFLLNSNKIIKEKFSKYNDIQKNFEKTPVVEYLNKNGLPETTKIIMQDIFAKAQIDYSKFKENEIKIIEQNMIEFLKFMTFVESDGGKYLENYQGSTAKGPFQILDGYKDGVRDEKYLGEGKFTTFETLLRTYIKYANNSKIPDVEDFGHPDWVSNSLNSKGKISPNDLTQEQNINLFLVGTFLGDGYANSELLMKVLLNGDKNSMEKIYEKHHTNPDLKTKAVVEKESFGTKLKEVFKKDQSFKRI